MESWFVRPDPVTLRLSDGQTLIVKRRLNAGEMRKRYARMYLAGVDGALKANPFEQGLNTITSFLLDWSLTDDTGRPVVIAGVTTEELTQVLDNLDPVRYGEILKAIDAHEDAGQAARAEEKKLPAGATASDPILPSPSVVDGASSGCVN